MIEYIIAFSMHIGMGDNYNSIHPRIQWNQENMLVGAYLNSHSEISTFVAHRWEHEDFGLEVGLVTGYNVAPVVPFVKVDYKSWWAAPAIHEGSVGFIFGYEWKF